MVSPGSGRPVVDVHLGLEWREVQFSADDRCRFLDFTVDGESLRGERYRAWDASCLGWGDEEEKAARRLLLEEPPEESLVASRRVLLYGSPMGLDIESGATTVVVEQHGDKILWRDAAFTTLDTPGNETPDGFHHDLDAYRQWPDFRFDSREYRRVIEQRYAQREPT